MAVLYNVCFLLLLLFPLLSQSHTLTKSSSSVAFLQHLKGCHKGDNLKDISKLKQYLEKFGYLDYKNAPKSNHSNDNYFDHLLEKAVKTYQANFHLNDTGALDSGTVATMMSPRCGVADIVNGTNRMHRTRHGHHPHGLRTVSHYSFFPRSPKWSKTRLTYGFLAGTPAAAVDPVSKAFLTWSQNSHFTFARANGNGRPDLTIGFFQRDHGDGEPFDGPGRTIAHAFAPEIGMFHYDADETYTTGVAPGAFDYETVALHEIGHLLGLHHSTIEGAIMYPKLPDGATKGLHQDDIRGIKDLYNV